VGHDGMDPPTWWLSAALPGNMRADLDHFAEVNPQHTCNSDEPGAPTLPNDCHQLAAAVAVVVDQQVVAHHRPAGSVQ